MAVDAFCAAVPPQAPTTASPSPMTASPAVSSRATMSRTHGAVTSIPAAAPVADGEVIRLSSYLSAVAGMPRVSTRVGRAAGTIVGAARVVEQDCPRMRVSVFVSGVNPVGDIKWLVLHGTGMADEPELLRLEGQLQHARRVREGLVYAGSSLSCPPADVIGDGIAACDTIAPAPSSTTPQAVSVTPVTGMVAPTATQRGGAVVGASMSTSDAAAGAGSPVVTDEELLAVNLPAAVGDPPVGNNPENDGSSYWEEDNNDALSTQGGRSIEADGGPVDVQPGVGAPPPPPIVESLQPPALVKPSKKVLQRLTDMLAVRGRTAQFVRNAFKGMVGAVAAEHKCGVKSIQLCLIPWWPYVLSEDPNEFVLPGTLWPFEVHVPKRMTLATKRSRDEDADGYETITLTALPTASSLIDDLVAAIILLHDKEKVTQVALANDVFLVQKSVQLTAKQASTEIAARLAAAKEKQQAAVRSRSASEAPRIAPATLAPRSSHNPFPPARPLPRVNPLRALGDAAAALASRNQRAAPRRASTGGRVSVGEARRAARTAAAQAADTAVAGTPRAAREALSGDGGLSPKRRCLCGSTAGSATRPSLADSDSDVDELAGPGGRRLRSTSGPCLLVGPTGDPIAKADAFFGRRELHGHTVPASMVVVFVDVVVSNGYPYRHERSFPKERPATQDTRPMWELQKCFIVWEKARVSVTDVACD